MKTMRFVSGAVALGCLLSASVAARAYGMERMPTIPVEEVVDVADVQIPSSFDVTSDAVVIIRGWFPNTCYRFKEDRVEHMGGNIHELTSYATVLPGPCLMVLVPYTREVSLGRLDSGNHTLRVMNSDGSHKDREFVID